MHYIRAPVTQLVYFRYSMVYSSDVIFSGNGTDFVYLQQAVQVQENEYVRELF